MKTTETTELYLRRRESFVAWYASLDPARLEREREYGGQLWDHAHTKLHKFNYDSKDQYDWDTDMQRDAVEQARRWAKSLSMHEVLHLELMGRYGLT
jgi:hypothetical protein